MELATNNKKNQKIRGTWTTQAHNIDHCGLVWKGDLKSKTIVAAAAKGVNVSNKFSTVWKVAGTVEKRLRARCKIGYGFLGFCFFYQTNTVFFNLDWKRRKEVRGRLVVVVVERQLRKRFGEDGDANLTPFLDEFVWFWCDLCFWTNLVDWKQNLATVAVKGWRGEVEGGRRGCYRRQDCNRRRKKSEGRKKS